MSGLVGFLLLAVVLSVTPGPDAVLVLRSSVRGGRRPGSATAIGAAAGSLAWGAAAAVGLAAVIAQSAALYQVIRLAGAVYLLFLGVATLLAQIRRQVTHPLAPDLEPNPRHLGGVCEAFAAGLLSDLLNPKVGLFYVAVVPQFVPVSEPVLRYSLLLCAIETTVAVVWFVLLAWLAHAALIWLRRPGVDRWLQRLLGVSLVGVGATVALEH